MTDRELDKYRQVDEELKEEPIFEDHRESLINLLKSSKRKSKKKSYKSKAGFDTEGVSESTLRNRRKRERRKN